MSQESRLLLDEQFRGTNVITLRSPIMNSRTSSLSGSQRWRPLHHIIPDRVKSPKQHPYGMTYVCVSILRSMKYFSFFSFLPQLIQYATMESDYYRNVCMSRGCTQALCSRSTRKRDFHHIVPDRVKSPKQRRVAPITFKANVYSRCLRVHF